MLHFLYCGSQIILHALQKVDQIHNCKMDVISMLSIGIIWILRSLEIGGNAGIKFLEIFCLLENNRSICRYWNQNVYYYKFEIAKYIYEIMIIFSFLLKKINFWQYCLMLYFFLHRSYKNCLCVKMIFLSINITSLEIALIHKNVQHDLFAFFLQQKKLSFNGCVSQFYEFFGCFPVFFSLLKLSTFWMRSRKSPVWTRKANMTSRAICMSYWDLVHFFSIWGDWVRYIVYQDCNNEVAHSC